MLIRALLFLLVLLNFLGLPLTPSWGFNCAADLTITSTDTFLLAVKEVQLEDVKEAFVKHFGKDPLRWPAPFKGIHKIGTKWSSRAMKSKYYRKVLSEEDKQKMLLQVNDPAEYWARNIYNGWDYGEWFDPSHLTVEGLPLCFLDRYLEEVFPLAWTDIRSTLRVKEYMLGLKDFQFKPYNSYDKKVALKRQQDVFAYNNNIIEAARRYDPERDVAFLSLLPRFVDTYWPGDEKVERKLEEQKKKVEEIVSQSVKRTEHLFRKNFFDNIPEMAYSWTKGSSVEGHLYIDVKQQKDKSFETLGRAVRIYDGLKEANGEKRAFEEWNAFALQWSSYPFFDVRIGENAQAFENNDKNLVFMRVREGQKEYFYVVSRGESGLGHKVVITCTDPEIPQNIMEEIYDQLFDAFVKASEMAYKNIFEDKSRSILIPGGTQKGRQLIVSCNLSKNEKGILLLNKDTFVTINIQVREKREPVSNAKIVLKKPEIGEVWSPFVTAADEENLYITTDPLGKSSVIFIPPSIDELKERNLSAKELSIHISDQQSGEARKIKFKFELPLKLRTWLEHEAIPRGNPFYNRVYFRIDGGEQHNKGEKCKVIIRATSSKGLFSCSPDGPWLKDQISLESEYGEEHFVYYKWDQNIKMKSPVVETVTIEAPEINLFDIKTFIVGVEPMIKSVEIAEGEKPIPGTYVPLKLTLGDKTEGESDWGSLLRSYGLNPVLEIEPIEIKKTAFENPKNEKILELLLSRVAGVKAPGGALKFDPSDFVFVKKSNSQWVLVKRNLYSGGLQGYPKGQSFPGFMPMSWGNYRFRIKLYFEDENSNVYNGLTSTFEEEIPIFPQSKEQMEGVSLLPLLVFYRALFPDGHIGDLSNDIEIERSFQEGKIEEGAFLLGKGFSNIFSVPEELSPLAKMKLERLRMLAAWADGREPNKVPISEIINSLETFREKLLVTIGGVYAEVLLGDSREDGGLPYSLDSFSDTQRRILKVIQAFLDGFGGYGFVVVFGNEINDLDLYDKESGKQLKPVRDQIFTTKSQETERVWVCETGALVPLRLGENLVMDLYSPHGPVLAIKILPNGINVRRFCVDKPKERVNIYGDVVTP